MFLLRETDRSVTDICFDVGFGSLGTFSRTFRDIVGENPTDYRASHPPIEAPGCFQMMYTRPRLPAGVHPRGDADAGRSSSSGEA